MLTTTVTGQAKNLAISGGIARSWGRGTEAVTKCKVTEQTIILHHAALRYGAGFVSFRKGGELNTNRLVEQELAILCLRLLQICLVYINTLMLRHVLTGRAWTARLGPDDLRALSLLFYVHVNPYGRFSLDLHERLPGLPMRQTAS